MGNFLNFFLLDHSSFGIYPSWHIPGGYQGAFEPLLRSIIRSPQSPELDKGKFSHFSHFVGVKVKYPDFFLNFPVIWVCAELPAKVEKKKISATNS